MAAGFVSCIDESGDEGLSGRAGSSEWFVLSAAITRKAQDHRLLPFIDGVRQRLNLPAKKPIHFRDLKHEKKVAYCTEIAAAPIRLVNVLVHKPSIREPELFQERYRLYFYTARYVLERVSWLCRDSADAAGCEAELIFSNRSGMKYSELCDYLRRLEDGEADSIHWPAIRPGNVVSLSSGKRVGLQLADAAAGAFARAIERDGYGQTEDRYARILRPVVYQRRGRYGGYGIKVWPAEAAGLIATDERLRWLREVYNITA